MTATLAPERTIAVPPLPIAERVAEIEALALIIGLTRRATEVQLLWLAHESLRGDDLWDAYLAAENAILCRNATSEDDGDYAGYEERADAAITYLIHGTTARGGRNDNTGDHS